jgi:alpha-tubulin suppressor-like RCC1 family protein
MLGRARLFLACLTVGGVLLATPSLSTGASAKAYARLTQTSMLAAQARGVKLLYQFPVSVQKVSFTLAVKKGSSWSRLRSFTRKQNFKKPHTMTVKQLFGSKPVRVGNYRETVGAGGSWLKARFSVLSPLLFNISAGSGHACSSLPSGQALCWGGNDEGDLGNGTTTGGAEPVLVTMLDNVTAVSAGYHHSCALLRSGNVACWGANETGQLGNGTKVASSTPVLVNGLQGAVQVSAGGSAVTAQTCALIGSGSISCWGGNLDGQLGDGLKADSLIPRRVEGITKAVQVSAGLRHSCALLADGRVKCWGWGTSGQLGNGKKKSSRVPVLVTGIANAIQVSAGGTTSCALLSTGAVDCWGDNTQGELGIGKKSPVQSPVPVRAKLPAPALAVSAGGTNVCAVLKGGVVFCWGDNGNGQLGVGKTFSSLTGSTKPLLIDGLSRVKAISVGDQYACAFVNNTTTKCWGDDSVGQLGNGMSGLSAVPVAVQGVTSVASVDTNGAFTCAALTDGEVSCWGRNSGGQLGVSTDVEVRTTPAIVKSVSNAVAVAAGINHACALLADHTVDCWGANKHGELGNDTTTSSLTPVEVSGITSAVAIGAGSDFSCALLADHTVDCWGENNASQLGDGTTTDRATPVHVNGITTAVSLSVGGENSCVVLTDGSVECWGAYDPNDPNGSPGTALPTKVPSVSNAIEASVDSQCALLLDGTVSCWGVDPLNPDRGSGLLFPITGLAGAAHLSTNCALLTGGGVYCWGSSESGQLGNGTVSFSGSYDTAVPVTGIANATLIDSDGASACAVLAGGTLECWGNDYWGQLGNGQMGFSTVPVSVVWPQQ